MLSLLKNAPLCAVQYVNIPNILTDDNNVVKSHGNVLSESEFENGTISRWASRIIFLFEYPRQTNSTNALSGLLRRFMSKEER